MVRIAIVREGGLAHRTTTEPKQSGPTRVLRRGDAFVTLDPVRTTMLAIGGCALLTLSAPADIARGIALPTDAPAFVPDDVALLGPVTAFVESTVDTASAERTSFTTYYLDRLLQEMAIGLLVETQRGGPTPRTRDAFTHAVALITAQHADSDLTVDMLAREVALSRRQLERVFQDRGTSVGRELRRARLDAAVRYLRDPGYDALTIDQVAQFCGLSNGSSLARAMATEGLPSPTKIRADRSPRRPVGADR